MSYFHLKMTKIHIQRSHFTVAKYIIYNRISVFCRNQKAKHRLKLPPILMQPHLL